MNQEDLNLVDMAAVIDAFAWAQWAEETKNATNLSTKENMVRIRLGRDISELAFGIGVDDLGNSIFGFLDIDKLFWMQKINWKQAIIGEMEDEIIFESHIYDIDGKKSKIVIQIPVKEDVLSIISEDEKISLYAFYIEQKELKLVNKPFKDIPLVRA